MIQDPTFWFLVAFVVFFALIGKTLWKFSTTTLDARASKIENTIEDAVKAREQARNLLSTVKTEFANAQTQAQEIVENAELEAAQLKIEAEKEIDEFLQRREKQGEQRIATIELLAIDAIKKQAIETGVNAAAAVLTSKIDKQAEQAILESALAGLRNHGFRSA